MWAFTIFIRRSDTGYCQSGRPDSRGQHEDSVLRGYSSHCPNQLATRQNERSRMQNYRVIVCNTQTTVLSADVKWMQVYDHERIMTSSALHGNSGFFRLPSFSNDLWQYLTHYISIMFDIAHCPRNTSYTRRLESWLYSCQYTDWCYWPTYF